MVCVLGQQLLALQITSVATTKKLWRGLAKVPPATGPCYGEIRESVPISRIALEEE
jgi:hypothetical protein